MKNDEPDLLIRLSLPVFLLVLLSACGKARPQYEYLEIYTYESGGGFEAQVPHFDLCGPDGTWSVFPSPPFPPRAAISTIPAPGGASNACGALRAAAGFSLFA